LPLIAPDLVLATGDLTDGFLILKLAKFKDSWRSKQHIEEWLSYNDAIES
jgi:hypothetical protein